MKTIDLSNQGVCLETDEREVKFVGFVPVKVAESLTKRTFDVVDVSEAVFEEKEEEAYVCLGWSHSGPVYGRSYMRKLDALMTIINGFNVKKLILPASLTRKQLNAVKRNASVQVVEVPSDAKLFSMKDGHLYNKKGTILMFENKEE